MHTSFDSTWIQRIAAVVIAVVATAWWLTVPGLFTSSTFIVLVGFLMASAWVAKNTIESAQPASSLAQSLHDIEVAAALKRKGAR